MKLKHTPGPWKAKKPKGSNGWYNVGPKDDDDIITCYGYGQKSKANARLVANAPRMFVELIRAYRHMDVGNFPEIEEIVKDITGCDIEEVASEVLK